MGLSRDSVGLKSVDCGLEIKKRRGDDKVIALAGNPNVGKSTVFNEMTGMNQHTGNWPGKTVANAQGYASSGKQGYVMVDIPGCYSLMAHSTEEEVARDFICFENPDAVVVVCDATCLERNLNLVLQILEASESVVVCVNLMDEAEKKEISIRFDVMEERLGVPVIGTAARSRKGLEQIYRGLERVLRLGEEKPATVTGEAFSDEEKGETSEEYCLEYETINEEQLEEEQLEEESEEEELDKAEQLEEGCSEKKESGEELGGAAHFGEEKSDCERHQEERRKEDQFEAEPVKSDYTAAREAEVHMPGAAAPGNLIRYPEYIEAAIARLTPTVRKTAGADVNVRWLSARLLESNENLMEAVRKYLAPVAESEEIAALLEEIRGEWEERGITQKQVSDDMASVFVRKAEFICRGTVAFGNQAYNKEDRVLDRFFTSKATGFPIMFLILLGVFWLTITGANYPSELINAGLFWLEDRLTEMFMALGIPVLIINLFIHGVYRVLAWVVSVMLPPMAIFFPLFTLLEDFGYLPRVAFNLDRCFKRCAACGKQALTMCME